MSGYDLKRTSGVLGPTFWKCLRTWLNSYPGLRGMSPYVIVGLQPRFIVESASLDDYSPGQSLRLRRKRRSTISAEFSRERFSAVADIRIRRETLSLPRHTRRWHDDVHRKSRAGYLLTVGAVANGCTQWFGTALVAHCSAKTATGNLWHCPPPEISLHKIAK